MIKIISERILTAGCMGLALSVAATVIVQGVTPSAQAVERQRGEAHAREKRASEVAVTESRSESKSESKSEAKEESAAQESAEEAQQTREQVITLTDLHEVGLSLERIKQQAINIYVEATRTPTLINSPIEVVDPRTIPVKQTNTNYLEPRREWLVYYMSTMEPIIELLAKDVKDSKSGVVQIVAPEAAKEHFEPILHRWEQDVVEMNRHLNDLLALFDDAPKNNIPIANSAVDIFKDVERLEGLRRAAHKLVQQAEKHPNRPATVKTPKG